MKDYKPIIGLVGRVDYASDSDCVICIWEEARRSIVEKGGIPILLLPPQKQSYEKVSPNHLKRFTREEKEDLTRLLNLCDGILFAGGYQWYAFDEWIYKIAYEQDIPMLGICLGMQMMVKVDNYPQEKTFDDTVLNKTTINHHQREKKYVHKVAIEKNTLLSQIVGTKTIQVNSKHHYHVEKVKQLRVSAISEDGLIEAVEDARKRFLLGVQWHPETMLSYDDSANRIMEAFLDATRSYRKSKELN